ncbi:MAG: peptidoglycan DD-metalloendopeptidase family protein [Pseudomonadota bacterium]
MMRAAALALTLAIAAPPAPASEAVAAAESAATALADAAGLLSLSENASDRVTALTTTVRAYEDGLAAMRQGLRQVLLRERTIRSDLDAKSETLSALLGVMQTMQTAPETLTLLHPSGPAASARSAMIVASVTPAITDEVRNLRAQLEELQALGTLQEDALVTLQAGLDGAQTARAALSQAISDRTLGSGPSAIEAATLEALLDSAETLQDFAGVFATADVAQADLSETAFATAKGTLSPPTTGAVIAGFNEPDAAGLRRPGILLATEPRALVTAPWSGTIRYKGPLLDYGEVVILEPEAGFLLIFSGLAEAYGAVGNVIDKDAALGLMGGQAAQAQEILIDTSAGAGQDRPETLYMELRQGQTPVDPADWFAFAAR